MTFTIGNNGVVAIKGDRAANKMGFVICLTSYCTFNAVNPVDAVSGELLNYFDVTYNSFSGCIEGIQKNIPIEPSTSFDIVISAKVTRASENTYINTIGAACGVTGAASANPEPLENNFTTILTHTTGVSLPVSLVNFTVKAQENYTALLDWSTSWEQANQKYVIERSKDLVRFEAVGEVSDVAGTSNSVNSYRFIDANPYRGTSYYRLRQIDTDGSSKTFAAKSVIIDGRYGVYPNPTMSNGIFTLQLDEPDTAQLHLYSGIGAELRLTRKVVGEQEVQLRPAVNLIPGLYILEVQERGAVRKHRLIVQP
ncbi:hypothetical protein GCM10028773_62870 [Spirosoma koreense]